MKIFVNKISRYIVLAIFIVILVFSILFINKVDINYDMTKYLPSNSNTKNSLEIVTNEFGENSMVQMMASNITIIEAEKLAKEVNKLPTVSSIIWLGVLEDISKPIEQMDQEMIKDLYYDDSYLFTINFNLDDYSIEVGDDINEIISIARNMNINVNFRGPAISNKSSRDKVSNEMFYIFVLAVPIAVFILILASKSWFEPIIVLLNLGVAILINMGTNFLQGSVSYITIAITSVLQMAMSLDFSLFLIHRYYEERKDKDKVTAAVNSTKAAFKSVTASALTTIFGFLALVIMQYKIGFDIGVALAKAIFISYLVTMILLPVLIVIFDKPLIKLKRERTKTNFSRTTIVIHKLRIVITVLLIVFGSFMFYKQSQTSYLYGDMGTNDANDQLYIDELAISEKFGAFQPILILYKHEDRSSAIALTEELYKIPEVRQIQSLVTSVDPTLPEDILPEEAISNFKSENYYRMIVFLDIKEENERMYQVSEQITSLVSDILPKESYLVGTIVAVEEIKTSVNFDGIFVQIVSALIIGLVIGIIFKSAIIPIILVLLIEISIWTNMAFTVFSGGTLVYIGYLVVSSLQLGATIDYAVLFTSRYQEYRETLDSKEAIIEASSKSIPTIIVSALVLSSAGFTVYFVSKLAIIKEIGMLIGRGALLSGVLVVFVLPALLLTFDKWTYKKKKIKEKRRINYASNEKDNIK